MLCHINDATFDRWEAYQRENPVWTLDALVHALLSQHFQEADTVKASVEAQERKKKGD